MKRSIALIALLIGGCTIPASPPAITPLTGSALGLDGATGVAAAPAVESEWWRAFGDPQL